MVMIKEALPEDYFIVTHLFEALIHEIEDRTHSGPNLFHTTNTGEKCREFIETGIYTVFLAFDEESKKNVGFLSLCESYSLYAGGSFAIIQEFFVQPDYRSKGVGTKLLKAAKLYGVEKGWKRLEVTTPPLSSFERTLSFYEQHGFQITGGRRMKKGL